MARAFLALVLAMAAGLGAVCLALDGPDRAPLGSALESVARAN